MPLRSRPADRGVRATVVAPVLLVAAVCAVCLVVMPLARQAVGLFATVLGAAAVVAVAFAAAAGAGCSVDGEQVRLSHIPLCRWTFPRAAVVRAEVVQGPLERHRSSRVTIVGFSERDALRLRLTDGRTFLEAADPDDPGVLAVLRALRPSAVGPAGLVVRGNGE